MRVRCVSECRFFFDLSPFNRSIHSTNITNSAGFCFKNISDRVGDYVVALFSVRLLTDLSRCSASQNDLLDIWPVYCVRGGAMRMSDACRASRNV